MTWRELWKSTVTNIKVLLGFSPPPPPPPAPIVRRKPISLTGTVVPPELTDSTERANPNQPGSQKTPQTIDLTATRPLPPSAPLRTRKPHMIPMDVGLNSAAFAAANSRTEAESVKGERAASTKVPVSTEPASSQPPALPAALSTPSVPPTTPEVTFTRQGVFHVEVVEVSDAAAFANGPEQDADPYFFPDSALQDGEPLSQPAPTDQADDFGDEHDNGHDDAGNSGDPDDDGVPLTTLLESLLFVAPEAVEPRQLAQTLGQPLNVIELGLAELADYYQRSLRGLRLQRFNNKVQLVTAPIAAPFIETFLNLDNSTKLSSPALETLAVIAYRQPVTRAQIEAVRGVDCAGVLRSLTQRGLVAEVGRLEGIGRPILYGVTDLFMQHFGLMEMTELPPLEETEADRLWAATVIDDQEADAPKAKSQ